MVFLGVYKALYPWTGSDDGMLPMEQGDLLFIVGKNDSNGWWRAKKKAVADDDDEPEGFVPSNYIEPAPVLGHAHTIYEYTRQTDEELSFPEDVVLQIFDTSDPDWILAGLDGDFGFVPSNYIEMQATVADEVTPPPSPDAPPVLPARPQSIIAEAEPEPEQQTEASLSRSVSRGPAAALAGVLQNSQNSEQPLQQPQHEHSALARDDNYDDDGSLSSPALPARPRPSAGSGSNSRDARPHSQPNRHNSQTGEEPFKTPGGFHMYNISEMVSVMGKRKKMPTTLGINLKTGIILIAPEHAQDDPPQEWTSDKMRHYSREGKHVFLELVRPSKSIDFHAGARDTAEEIMGALSDLAGALRAEGLREAILSGGNVRKGQVLYDFMAQGDDEVTVAAGDQVLVLDDSKSDEWWQVRRVKNGQQGVVPSSYIELTKTASPTSAPGVGQSAITSARSTVEQNRLEEIRLTKAAIKANREPQQQQQRSRRGSSRSDFRPKAKPDSAKVRTWTDRSGAFSVDAQFLGLRDGKIHLHKLNGVKIAVPIAKMSQVDLEYVEQTTGMSLDDDKPLADVKRAKSTTKSAKVGAIVGRSDKAEPEYDWFQFFLSCDVAVGLCERYAQAFTRDSMDESVLPDVNASILRTLGLREGDILKVMRHLDTKFDRDRSGNTKAEDDNVAGGLFSGPGGALRNNTRKGRPAPAVQTNDVVDAAALSASSATKNGSMDMAVSPAKVSAGGFDDDAWEVKTPQSSNSESKGQQYQPASSGGLKPQASTTVAESPPLLGSMKDLSLLTQPLQPTKVEAQPTAVSLDPSQGPAEQGQQVSQQLAGASPSFFSSMPRLSTTSPQSLAQPLARNRPPAPLSSGISPGLGSLPPPPTTQRSLSAPQPAQQTVFSAATMAPQMTGSLQSQVAPPGQSLNDLSNARMQQQYAVQMQQMPPVVPGYGGMQPQPMMSFPTGQPMMQQPMMTGMLGASPFADPVRQTHFSPLQVQPTGFQQSQFPQSMAMSPPYGMQHSQATGGINNFLPPALEPQRTGAPPPMSQPLLPQKTGPPPPVRFGMPAEAKKMTSQQTGRRANLAQATPDNPFGF
ncbi:hypothetical protein CDD81_4731 [Ophiocordyceps australis]|uniref:Actin cytoskeleton-regulatory complex protein SLA1 n=1 Tax=Ophiocordyceps australis TaxID=1399860 RepID=A0A2C5XQK3_9HYPO|nr:hypothetical protein CDD81_4731 [Ophiocordyceps australis]